MADQDSNNHKPRRYCDPHDGSRTHYWRVFERNFRVGASADFMREDEHSIWSVIDDTHQGGLAVGAPALPGHAQAGHAAAARRQTVRVAVAFARIYDHINNEHLREMMVALPNDMRRARAAWLLVLDNCSMGTSDLNVQAIDTSNTNAVVQFLTDIGFLQNNDLINA